MSLPFFPIGTNMTPQAALHPALSPSVRQPSIDAYVRLPVC